MAAVICVTAVQSKVFLVQMEVKILCHDKQIINYLITRQILLLLEENVSIQSFQFHVMRVKVQLVLPEW